MTPRDLFILPGTGLVSGLNSAAPVLLEFVQNDTVLLSLHGLAKSADRLGDLHAPAHLDYSTLEAAVTLIDAPPKSGTFNLRAGTGGGALTTAALQYNVSKADFAATLNALANVATAGGLTAITSGAANIYGYIWNNPDAALEITIVQNKLAPLCLVAIKNDSAIPGKTEIKLHQAPVAFCNQFSLPAPPPVTCIRVRGGSAQVNEIQRLTVPSSAVGQFAAN